jgi:CTP synthase (UTP-ammonia lyase)
MAGVREPVEIGILGDYDPASPTLPAVETSIDDAAATLGITCQWTWLATDRLVGPELEAMLAAFDGLWAAPGSPYRSFEGMLRGIEFARRRNWPFVGT